MLLLKHFFQSLRGIGAMDAFRNGKERRVTIRRARHSHGWDSTRECRWYFDPLWGATTSTGQRVVSVEVWIAGGRIAVEVLYHRWIPARLLSTYPHKWAPGYMTTDDVYATFSNPMRAAEYVSAWLGYHRDVTCECHQSDCALAA